MILLDTPDLYQRQKVMAKTKLNLSEAAREWGISRATINRKKKNGTLSVTKDGRSVFVDKSEMYRVFGEPKQGDTSQSSIDTVSEKQLDTTVEAALFQQKIEFLEQQNEQLKSSLEKVTANEQKLLGIVENQTRLLTDETKKIQSKSGGFWSRLFG